MTQARPSSVRMAPPPWELHGSGYIFAVRMPQAVLDHGSFLPEGCPRLGRGHMAYAMFVDYAESDVGPYHELLYIPGRVRIGRRRDLSISRIYVSSWASVLNGEHNWGIPKDRCDFDVRYGADGIDRVRLTAADGAAIAEMELRARGPRLPAPGHWAPAAWRTLSQLRDGQVYTYTPSASGRVRFASVLRWRFDPRYFPDLGQGRVVAAARITDFRMIFPVAEIEPLAPY
ncbi:MAG: acetoacetate decarboxylase family protein [Nevskia sp.]|nr:acetoacetate decarboxylase family protein [Nevskia sp.]